MKVKLESIVTINDVLVHRLLEEDEDAIEEVGQAIKEYYISSFKDTGLDEIRKFVYGSTN